jgi:hypothetical protein
LRGAFLELIDFFFPYVDGHLRQERFSLASDDIARGFLPMMVMVMVIMRKAR